MSARADQLCEEGLAHHRRGDLLAAEQRYLQALALAPQAFAALQMMGVLRAQQGRSDEAVRLLRKALEVQPHDAAAWGNLGGVLAGAGRHQEALSAYTRALALSPADVEGRLNKARCLCDLGRGEEALADYEAVLSDHPRNLSALNEHGHVLWSLGRLEEALACFEAALRVDEHDAEALNNRGNILRHLRRFEDAVPCYEAVLERHPDLAQVWSNHGVTLAELGRAEEALASYERALALDPGLAAAWNNRGLTLREVGRPEEALESYERALALDPGFVAAWNNRSKALCERGLVDEAFAGFTRAAHLTYAQEPESLIFAGGERLGRPALDRERLRASLPTWRRSEPPSVVVDGFLTAEALAALRTFCWGSSVWRRAYGDSYVGAFPESGFACPLLAQIAEELRRGLPEIFAPHPLRYLWAFRYGETGVGTHVHADDAALNVNFWITPDEANLDPEHGGLIFWDKRAPADWDYARFNGDAAAAADFLERSGATATTVPYRENRAVIFDSALFHATDTYRFRPGLRNRRINITMLFGRRESSA